MDPSFGRTNFSAGPGFLRRAVRAKIEPSPTPFSNMTIYEFANGTQAQKVAFPEGFRALREVFPPDESDILAAERGQLVIAINHVQGRYAVSRVGRCVLGKTDEDITSADLEKLQNAMV